MELYTSFLMQYQKWATDVYAHGTYSIPLFYLIAFLVLFGLWKTALREERWSLYLSCTFFLDFITHLLNTPLIEKNFNLNIPNWVNWLTPLFLFYVPFALTTADPFQPQQKPIKEMNKAQNLVTAIAELWHRFWKTAWHELHIFFSIAKLYHTIWIIPSYTIVCWIVKPYNVLAPINRLFLVLFFAFTLVWTMNTISEEIALHRGKISKYYPTFIKTAIGFFGLFALLFWFLNPIFSIHLAGDKIGDWWNSDVSKFPTMASFDHLTIILMSIAKFIIFMGALLILARTLGAWATDQYMLNDVTEEKIEIMDPHCKAGLLKALGEDLGADHIALYVRLPGSKYITWWGWFQPDLLAQLEESERKILRDYFESNREKLPKNYNLQDTIKSPMRLGFPKQESPIGNIFKTGISEKTIVPRNTRLKKANKHASSENTAYADLIPNIRSKILLPVFYHGGVIAVLEISSLQEKRFTQVTERRAERYASLLSLMTHPRRELSALEILSKELDIISKTEYPTVYELLLATARTLQFFLESTETAINWFSGFDPYFLYLNQEDKPHLDEESKTNLETKGKRLLKDVYMNNKSMADVILVKTTPEEAFKEKCEELNLSFSKIDLKSWSYDKKNEITLGEMFFAIKEEKERPTLVRSPIFLEAVAGVATKSLLDGISLLFSKRIKELRSNFEGSKKEHSEWQKLVDRELDFFNGEERYFQTSLGKHNELNSTAQLVKPNDSMIDHRITEIGAKYTNITGIGDVTVFKDQTVSIDMKLDKRNHITFKNNCIKYDRELQLDKPWLRYLMNFNLVIAYRLDQIEAELNSKYATKLKLKAQENIVQSLWVHELGNTANEIRMAATNASELAFANQPDKSRNWLIATIAAANKVGDTVNKLIQKSISDEAQYSIDFATEQTKIYFNIIFERYNITFKCNALDEKPALPYSHLFLVFSNLTSNAIRFLKEHPGPREIIIYTEKRDSQLWISFSDTGPGVPEELTSTIFEMGFSTEQEHTGLGLSGIKSLLADYGCDIQLDPGYHQGARFLFTLPVIQGDNL